MFQIQLDSMEVISSNTCTVKNWFCWINIVHFDMTWSKTLVITKFYGNILMCVHSFSSNVVFLSTSHRTYLIAIASTLFNFESFPHPLTEYFPATSGVIAQEFPLAQAPKPNFLVLFAITTTGADGNPCCCCHIKNSWMVSGALMNRWIFMTYPNYAKAHHRLKKMMAEKFCCVSCKNKFYRKRFLFHE